MSVRIAGQNLPEGKRVVIALTYIYGIGTTRAQKICKEVNIPEAQRVHQLSEEEIARLRSAIDKDYIVEGELRSQVSMNIKKLKDIRCYRGIRHQNKLPVRGQNTRTNARTRKGKAIAIAGKKK